MIYNPDFYDFALNHINHLRIALLFVIIIQITLVVIYPNFAILYWITIETILTLFFLRWILIRSKKFTRVRRVITRKNNNKYIPRIQEISRYIAWGTLIIDTLFIRSYWTAIIVAPLILISLFLHKIYYYYRKN